MHVRATQCYAHTAQNARSRFTEARVPPQLTISEPSKIVTAASPTSLQAWQEHKLQLFEWLELIFCLNS